MCSYPYSIRRTRIPRTGGTWTKGRPEKSLYGHLQGSRAMAAARRRPQNWNPTIALSDPCRMPGLDHKAPPIRRLAHACTTSELGATARVARHAARSALACSQAASNGGGLLREVSRFITTAPRRNGANECVSMLAATPPTKGVKRTVGIRGSSVPTPPRITHQRTSCGPARPGKLPVTR